MSETALARRYRLSASLRGTHPEGRKTFTVRKRRAPGEMPPYRLSLLLPARWLVPGGDTGVAGVTIAVDPFSGNLAVVEHCDLEWACRQLGRFLLKVANDERIMSAIVSRDGVTRGQQIVVGPDMVEFPRMGGTTWRVT